MPSLNLFVALAIALAFVTVGILLFPNVKITKKKTKVQDPVISEEANKNWKMVALRLEKHIYTLRKEIALLEKRGKTLERGLMIEKEKGEKALEKLTQERGWQKKDMSDREKQGLEIIRLNQDLKMTEQNLTQEHGQRLRLEKEMKEIMVSVDEYKGNIRSMETQIATSQAQIEAQRREIIEITATNKKLSQKHDDATWIAKSEYVKMERDLKMEIRTREREIDRLRTILRKEGFEG